MRKHWVLLLLVLLLAGCAPSAPAPGTGTEVPAGTDAGSPGSAVGPEIAIVQEPEGYRLETESGEFGSAFWVGPAQVLVQWSATGQAPQPGTLFYVDLVGRRSRVVMTGDLLERPVVRGTRAVLLQQGGQVALVDGTTGALETIWASDPQTAQWAGGETHSWQFAGQPHFWRVDWLTDDAFLVTISPAEYDLAGHPWGKLLLVDTKAHKVWPLAEAGELGAILPDGSLLVRRGWMDGELMRFGLPYGSTPETVAPAGPWTAGFAAGPRTGQAAWLELDLPPGDWSKRVPLGPGSGDPEPKVRRIAVWDGKQVQRFPITNAYPGQALRWRKSGAGVLFTGEPVGNKDQTALFELSLDGKVTQLARYGAYGPFQVVAEAADGTLWYTASALGLTETTLARRSPDGTVTVLRKETPAWYLHDGQLVSLNPDGTDYEAQDLVTGNVTKLPVSPAWLSTDGKLMMTPWLNASVLRFLRADASVQIIPPGVKAAMRLDRELDLANGVKLTIKGKDGARLVTDAAGKSLLEKASGVEDVLGLFNVGAPYPVLLWRVAGGGSMGMYYEAYLYDPTGPRLKLLSWNGSPIGISRDGVVQEEKGIRTTYRSPDANGWKDYWALWEYSGGQLYPGTTGPEK